VDAIDIKLGQATMPGFSAIRVVNMCSLKVKGEVAESYLSKVKKGNDVEIILPDLQDTIKTKISYAARVISPLNRSFTVTVNLDCMKDYHPNMIAILKIIDYSNPKAFVVPVNMIQKTEEGDFVFIAQNNKAKKARVKTGRIYNGSAEVLDGLKDGDKLITKGFQELNEGEEIKF
jgi:multidrug efflux pump subunit AcrA (membrane-fusion protein)